MSYADREHFHLLRAYYCPVCGDAASAWVDDRVNVPEFLCRRGHRGVWVENEKSARAPEYPLPSQETVDKWVERMKEKSS